MDCRILAGGTLRGDCTKLIVIMHYYSGDPKGPDHPEDPNGWEGM